MNREKIKPYLYWGITAVCVIAVSIIIAFLLNRFEVVLSGIKTVARILTPIIYGAALAFLMSPVYDKVSKWAMVTLKRIIKNDIPEAEIIGTAENETAYWKLLKDHQPDLVLLDLGLGGSTTVGVEICRHTKEIHPEIKVLIFTGEILNEKLWVDVLDAGCDGIILKSGELLTRGDVSSVMDGKRLVFNQPILEKIVSRFKASVDNQLMRQEALINYEIDEYDERFLRHLALGYTKEQITNLRGMPFGVKSLEKRQNELVQKLFPDGNSGVGVNATRLVVRAFELRILDIDNLRPDEE